jgi:hypothetical protein
VKELVKKAKENEFEMQTMKKDNEFYKSMVSRLEEEAASGEQSKKES